MNQQSEHLSSAQIEDYGVQTSGAGSDGDIAVEKHLDDCPSCRGRVLEFQRRRLAARPGMTSPSKAGISESPGGRELHTFPTSPDCLSEEDLRKQAAGLSPEAVASQWTRHINTCNRCATLLRIYIEDFSDDFNPEESALLQQLKSASPDWQRQAARKMLQTAFDPVAGEVDLSREGSMEPDPAPPGWAFSWKWAAIPAAAACVVVVLVFWYTRPPTPEKVETLLAEAQTQHRTLEMRWPGAQWAAPAATMGSEHSSASALREAEEALNKLPEAERKQEKWTRARAEKEIAAGNPQAAVTLLQPVESSATAPVELRLDLAIAYFAMGKQTYDPNWYKRSRVVLDGILQQDPRNTVALFNRALITRQLNDLGQSKKDWETFLSTETDTKKNAGWRDEAHARLKSVLELLRK